MSSLPVPPADAVYRGMCATTYDLLLPGDQIGDEDFYREAIRHDGQPALEIGCGTGRLLIAYLAEGLDVDGVDHSGEMLEICRGKASAKQLDVTLHQQAMEDLDLARRYALIYVPVGTLMLLSAADALRALARFHEHLIPGGRLLVPLHDPSRADVATEVAAAGTWRVRRERVDPTDGTGVRCWELATYDLPRQQKHAWLRFEVLREGAVVATEQHASRVRWYTQPEFSEMLAGLGFSEVRACRGYTEEPASAQDAAVTFDARRDRERPPETGR